MKILFLTFYFEPDLCAGSFRNTSLFKELLNQIDDGVEIEVVTTHPNRYSSYKAEAQSIEKLNENITINRIKVPEHNSGIKGQILSFMNFYIETRKLVNNKHYDIVYASSSRLFTALLGSKIAREKEANLYLDIRDIFRETIVDVLDNRILKIGLNLILRPIEKYTFGRANHINLVSEGFKSYFKKYKTNFSFYTNGIDDIFLENNIEIKEEGKEKKIVVYGGNIGKSQGLDIIIPKLAREFKDTLEFWIIGDGGAKELLEKNLLGIDNVKLIPPVSRDELITYYHKADFLFLHLNKQEAFERVIPSKIFEYSTFDKPIIAGVSGFANKFMNEHISNIILFEPGDVSDVKNKLSSYKYKVQKRRVFIDEFSRKSINVQMAKSILNV